MADEAEGICENCESVASLDADCLCGDCAEHFRRQDERDRRNNILRNARHAFNILNQKRWKNRKTGAIVTLRDIALHIDGASVFVDFSEYALSMVCPIERWNELYEEEKV